MIPPVILYHHRCIHLLPVAAVPFDQGALFHISNSMLHSLWNIISPQPAINFAPKLLLMIPPVILYHHRCVQSLPVAAVFFVQGALSYVSNALTLKYHISAPAINFAPNLSPSFSIVTFLYKLTCLKIYTNNRPKRAQNKISNDVRALDWTWRKINSLVATWWIIIFQIGKKTQYHKKNPQTVQM